MSTEKTDTGVVKSFRFSTYSADAMQRWIDSGYFENDEDLAVNAYKIFFRIMEEIEKDKQVVDFNTVIIGIEIDVPEQQRKHSLQ